MRRLTAPALSSISFWQPYVPLFKSQREHVGQGYLKDRRNMLVKLRSVVRRLFTFRHDTLRLCEIVVVEHDHKHVTLV